MIQEIGFALVPTHHGQIICHPAIKTIPALSCEVLRERCLNSRLLEAITRDLPVAGLFCQSRRLKSLSLCELKPSIVVEEFVITVRGAGKRFSYTAP